MRPNVVRKHVGHFEGYAFRHYSHRTTSGKGIPVSEVKNQLVVIACKSLLVHVSVYTTQHLI